MPKRTTSSIVIFVSGLLLGLGIGYFLFSNDPDNIMVLENGKYNYPIDKGLNDSLIVLVPDADSTFTIDISAPQQKPIYLLAVPGLGFISTTNNNANLAATPDAFDEIYERGNDNQFLTDYLMNDVEQICKISPTTSNGNPNTGRWRLRRVGGAWDVSHEPLVP